MPTLITDLRSDFWFKLPVLGGGCAPLKFKKNEKEHKKITDLKLILLKTKGSFS